VNELVAKENCIFNCPLNQLSLEVRLSLFCILVSMCSHKREKSTELVEFNEYFIICIACETWDVSADKRNTCYS
jgi:uncharacterized protein with PQ loop repeat